MTSRVAISAAVAAAAVSLALAPTASAQTEPTFSLTAVGSTNAARGHVVVTVSKSEGPLACSLSGFEAGATDLSEDNRVFLAGFTNDSPDAEVWRWAISDVPVGVYDVHWSCTASDGIEWGSFDSVPDVYKLEPIRNVRVGDEPNVADPIGGGSIDFGSLGSGSTS